MAHDHEHGDEHAGDVALDEDAERAELEHELRKRIALSQIRQYGDPVLRMQAAEVTEFDGELDRVAERMIELMHDADGVGLAATQIGVLRRFFVFHHADEDRVLVNPAITSSGVELETDEEGCLSLGQVRVPVERHLAVTIEGLDAAGEPVTLQLEGLGARIVQHELDHLDGMLVIDRTDPASRREALRQLRPRLRLAG